jgi:hypothetical protein
MLDLKGKEGCGMKIPELTSPEAIRKTVEDLGFLPFFRNEIPGWSIEEHTPPELWFTDRPGPWEWKGPVASSESCVYGKFCRGRAGFISRDWFPAFANYRRDGYDFDARYDDGLASHRDKLVFDLLAERGVLPSKELKRLAGYGKDGEKGFDGLITRLQMQTYVIISDFYYAMDRHGREYGWGIARYATPEARFGPNWLAEAYREDPAASRRQVYAHLQGLFPQATEKQLRRLLGD